MTTTLSSKGQIVIPLEIRNKLGLPAGAVISCEIVDGKIVLDPNPDAERAVVVAEEEGRPVLVAPTGSPEMTPDLVKNTLSS